MHTHGFGFGCKQTNLFSFFCSSCHTGGANDTVKAGSSGEHPRAIGGLVSNLPYPRVNKTKQHTASAPSTAGTHTGGVQ